MQLQDRNKSVISMQFVIYARPTNAGLYEPHEGGDGLFMEITMAYHVKCGNREVGAHIKAFDYATVEARDADLAEIARRMNAIEDPVVELEPGEMVELISPTLESTEKGQLTDFQCGLCVGGTAGFILMGIVSIFLFTFVS